MFIERKINALSDTVELWKCEWENTPGSPPRKVFLEKIGDEQPLAKGPEAPAAEAKAICWSYGRTLGNIAVYSQDLLGRFPGRSGNDAVLPCDMVHAGKYRHGADRWWCRTHQAHWGTKADYKAFDASGEMQCANRSQPMHYVISPFELDLEDYAEIGIWCSMPAALSTEEIRPRPPRIHVHVRTKVEEKKIVDRDFPAISLVYRGDLGLFGTSEITRVNVTPPAAFEFVCGLELGRVMDCVNCSYCGYPHLDLGDFGREPHRKHFCGNCGRDSTWSKKPIVSTPLQPLHERYAKTLKYEVPDRRLDLDKFKGCRYAIWASTPAVLWTAVRPQEYGIHVHVHDGKSRVVDDTFGEVTVGGKLLDRSELIRRMISRSIT